MDNKYAAYDGMTAKQREHFFEIESERDNLLEAEEYWRWRAERYRARVSWLEHALRDLGRYVESTIAGHLSE